MKQAEKLDLILRELYRLRFDGKYYSIEFIGKKIGITIESHDEARILTKRLEEDGFVISSITKDTCYVKLNSYGIEYCEEESYVHKGNSIITNTYNMSITGSPNANIVSNSNDVNIEIANYQEINKKIGIIKNSINDDNSLSKDEKENILECLDEIENSLNLGRKPKFAFNQLTEIASNLAGIGSLIIDLGKLIFGIN